MGIQMWGGVGGGAWDETFETMSSTFLEPLN